jgi:hypothetical protein
MIAGFTLKILDFFAYVRNHPDGERLIAKISSNVSELEIRVDFESTIRKSRSIAIA